MRSFLSGAALAACIVFASVSALLPAPAFAQEAEGEAAPAAPGTFTPQIVSFNVGEVQVPMVMGGGAWGDVLIAINQLQIIGEEEADNIAPQLWARRDLSAPIFLFQYANMTVDDDPDQAVYAYLLGQVRSLYDAQRCLDSSAMQTLVQVEALRNEALIAAAQDTDRLETQLQRLISSREAFTGQGSPWWICSSSTQVFAAAQNEQTLTAADWLKAEGRWESIRERISTSLDRQAAALAAR